MVWGTPQSVNSRVEWSYDDNDGKYEFVGFIGASNSQNVRNLSPIAFKVAECRYGEVEEEIEETIEEDAIFPEQVAQEVVIKDDTVTHIGAGPYNGFIQVSEIKIHYINRIATEQASY